MIKLWAYRASQYDSKEEAQGSGGDYLIGTFATSNCPEIEEAKSFASQAVWMMDGNEKVVFYTTGRPRESYVCAYTHPETEGVSTAYVSAGVYSDPQELADELRRKLDTMLPNAELVSVSVTKLLWEAE